LREIVDVSLVPPVCITPSELENPLVIDAGAFRARHLRLPTPGEVGCALAHRAVHELIVEGPRQWALVFEDDAVLDNPGLFKARLEAYERVLDVDDPIVINVNIHAIPQSRRRLRSSGLMPVRIPPYPATAYAINKSAAALFLRHQEPIRSQADWPTSTGNVTFYVDTQSSVWESTDLASRIDESGGREQIPTSRKVLVWSGIWYWRERKHFSSFRDFWYSIPRQRLGFHAYTIGIWWRKKTKWLRATAHHSEHSQTEL